jgi:hypothetical protein
VFFRQACMTLEKEPAILSALVQRWRFVRGRPRFADCGASVRGTAKPF